MLARHGESDQSQLGAWASIDRSTLTPLLDGLERLGLVSKTIDPGNRRRRLISITDGGRQTLDAAAPATRDIERQAKDILGSEGFDQLVFLLRRLGDYSS